MFGLRISYLAFFFLLVAQVFCTVTLQTYSDDTYGWVWNGVVQHGMQAGDIHNAVQQAYLDMRNDAHGRRIPDFRVPKVMAAVYLPSHRLLVMASSIKGGRAGTPGVATEDYCSDQHNHGSCAEMHALAALNGAGYKCKGGLVAAFGLQGTNTQPVFMHPCQDQQGKWGCMSFCKQEEMRAITKRALMRIEPKPVEESVVAERAVLEKGEDDGMVEHLTV